jgi:hypothetical protein
VRGRDAARQDTDALAAVSLDDLAAETVRGHEECERLQADVVEWARRTGEALLKAKKEVDRLNGGKRGAWERWRRKHCPGVGKVQDWRYRKFAEGFVTKPSLDAEARREEWRRIGGNKPKEKKAGGGDKVESTSGSGSSREDSAANAEFHSGEWQLYFYIPRKGLDLYELVSSASLFLKAPNEKKRNDLGLNIDLFEVVLLALKHCAWGGCRQRQQEGPAVPESPQGQNGPAVPAEEDDHDAGEDAGILVYSEPAEPADVYSEPAESADAQEATDDGGEGAGDEG